MNTRKTALAGIVVFAGAAAALILSSCAKDSDGQSMRVGSAAPNGIGARDDDSDDGTIIPFSQAPEAVQAAALKLVAPAGAEAITQVEKEPGKYGVEFIKDGQGWSADISPTGDVSDLEQEDHEDD